VANYRAVYRACKARDARALEKSIRDIYAFGKKRLIPLLREQENQKQTR
jgi:DNA-binding FadR family transcriptional regulator